MDELTRKRLWDDYRRSKSDDSREKLILEYIPLVKVVAGRLSMYLGYNVDYEDLCSYGIFGLIDAIDKFDKEKDVKFETYASLRIRGAILDQIRKLDWIPRTVRQRQRQLDTAMRELENELGRPATDDELAKRVGISEDELSDWQNQCKVSNVVSLNEYLETGADISNETGGASRHFDSPESSFLKDELKEKLIESLDVLTEKEKNVVVLYYYEELTLKEISNVLDVSESRVSQLHTKALNKMKGVLGKYTMVFD
ncbi:MAG: FliA/WhiG family RNA polymerase sigma factor [Lachnospiraceae bacterium]|jgi:RNA polymerase sigma factor for flagellar operon FliA|nr:FliA/WhiG family RNA polymerase sigma factor [Lachnospiraceae bacterium]MBP5275957.1 FliA/WhiG family RNA polymerase sigma factor [Lachnospiraceae bacterium]MBP5565188.1 FliA/WhiG family RNA polymerase sigma factor [Lachnospiraceae bacterium]MCR4696988.1 FliA/WhiG family RNA polymerase sigma factor [Lachnospiraceae bacterium]